MKHAVPPILDALETTPMRDILRGRLTCRLDWRRPIAQAGLPEPISALIERVVKRARLNRLEKTDVSRELCTHFTDGIKEGTSQDELVKDFGDERTAAKLITRAKKRARPLHKACKRAAQVLGVFVLLLIVVYAVEFVRFNTAKPNIARNYTAEYNAKIDKIPMDQRAWPIYREAILKLYPLTEEEQDSIGALPTDPLWDTQVALIAEKQEAMELFRRAAAKPHIGCSRSNEQNSELFRAMNPNEEYPYQHLDKNPMFFMMYLPHLGGMRDGARLFSADALRAAIEGDADLAIDNLQAMVSMASLEVPAPTLIEQLVDISIYTLASQAAAEILWSHAGLLSDEQLVGLAHTFASYRGGGQIILSLEGERILWDDIVQRVYTDDGSGDGHLTPEGKRISSGPLRLIDGSYHITGVDTTTFLGPIENHLIAGRREMNAKYNELITMMTEYARQPVCKQLQSPWGEPAEFEEFFALESRETRYQLIHALMPALGRAMRTGRSAEMTRDATVTLIALERIRRDTGAYPETLGQLVPQYLPAVPEDIFDCNSLRYELRNGRPYIYSVGYDQQDNLGEPTRRHQGGIDPIVAATQSFPGGDWIFFPPQSYWDAQLAPDESGD